MNPERVITIKGNLIEEFYWNGKMIVYINHSLTSVTYETAINHYKSIV